MNNTNTTAQEAAKEIENIAEQAFDNCFDFAETKPNTYSRKELKHDIIEAVKEGISLYAKRLSPPTERGGLQWVRASEDNLPPPLTIFDIRWDGNQEKGDRRKVIELLENGWLNVEWLLDTPAEVQEINYTEEQIRAAINAGYKHGLKCTGMDGKTENKIINQLTNKL